MSFDALVLHASGLDPSRRIAWVLECGCEPVFTHCDQCDLRRKARAKVDKQERLDALATTLRAAGYTVEPPQTC